MAGLAVAAGLMVGTTRAADGGGAMDRPFGAGVILGEPTGVSVKWWLSERSALDGALGWSFADEDNFEMHADYLYHFNDVIPVERGRLPLYVGAGLRYKVRDNEDDLFGFRGVVGIDYLFDNAPVDIFFEAGPILDVTPDAHCRFTVAIGTRFWF